MKQDYLSKNDLNLLRKNGVLSSDEIAYWAGDILVAENVITSQKRNLQEGLHLIRESSSPSLLKG